MNTGTILFLGRAPSPMEAIRRAVEDSCISVTHASDWLSALHYTTSSPPGVVLIGPDIPAQEIRLFLERTKSNPSLRDLPSILLVENTSREGILELITLGIRSYILTTCQESMLRCRLSCHLPALSDKSSTSPQPSEKSDGAHISQCIERNLEDKLHTCFPCIPVIEQIFSQSFGITIRESIRQISFYEKIDEMKLRLGGHNSYLVGIQLLSAGKIRIGFRDKTERLSLADNALIMTREKAIEFVDAYLAYTQKDNTESEPSTQTCRLIMP